MAKVFINAKFLALEQYYGSGFYSYLKELLHALHELEHTHPYDLHHYTVLLPKLNSTDTQKTSSVFNRSRLVSSKHIQYLEITSGSSSFEKTVLEYAYQQSTPHTVIFLPHWDIPKDFWKTLKFLKQQHKFTPKIVSVIHDLIPSLFLTPSFILTGKTPLNMITLRGVSDYLKLKKHQTDIDHIVTISKTSAMSIAALFGSAISKKVSIIPPAMGKNFRKQTPHASTTKIDAILKKYGLTSNEYLIYFGGATKRKNLHRLVVAYQLLYHAYQKKSGLVTVAPPPLVMVGTKEKLNSFYFRDLIHNHQLLLLPKLSEEELITLIRDAMFSVYPSLYEGFGLPVLESLALGTLPLLSDIPANREFFLNKETNTIKADFLFNPYDSYSIAQCMAHHLNHSESIQMSYDKIKVVLNNFSWIKSAQTLSKTFSSLYKEN